MEKETTIYAQKRALVQAGIVTPRTACASLPLQITFPPTLPSSSSSSRSRPTPLPYDAHFAFDFFSSPWPLDHAPLPLTCSISPQGDYQYSFPVLPTSFTQPIFSLQPFLGKKQRPPFPEVFDQIVEIHGFRFRAVQQPLLPLSLQTDKNEGPILSGSHRNLSVVNNHPMFVYNARLKMVHMSPPIFRALAAHMCNKPSSPLFASFLVSVEGRGQNLFTNFYLLQFLQAPPEGSVSVASLRPVRRDDVYTTMADLEQIKQHAEASPYFVPQPIDLSSVFVSPEDEYKVCFFDSYSYGTMAIALDQTCRKTIPVSSSFLSIGGRVFDASKPFLLFSTPTDDPILSLVRRGVSWPEDTIDFMNHLASKDGCMDLDEYFNLVVFSEASQSFEELQHLLVPHPSSGISAFWPIFVSRNTMLQTCPPGVLCDLSASSLQTLRGCTNPSACNSVLPPQQDDITTSHFRYARNLLSAPAFVDFGPIFAQFGSVSKLIGDMKQELRLSETYHAVSQAYCDVRMRVDSLHNLLAGSFQKIPLPTREVLATIHADASSNSNEQHFYVFPPRDVHSLMSLALTIELLARCLGFACFCYTQVKPDSPSASSLWRCMESVLFASIERLVQSMLDTIAQIDAAQTFQPHPFSSFSLVKDTQAAIKENFSDFLVKTPSHLQASFLFLEKGNKFSEIKRPKLDKESTNFIDLTKDEDEEEKEEENMPRSRQPNQPTLQSQARYWGIQERDQLLKLVYFMRACCSSLTGPTRHMEKEEHVKFIEVLAFRGIGVTVTSILSIILSDLWGKSDTLEEWLTDTVYQTVAFFTKRQQTIGVWHDLVLTHIEKECDGQLDKSLVAPTVCTPLTYQVRHNGGVPLLSSRLDFGNVMMHPFIPSNLRYVFLQDSQSFVAWNLIQEIEQMQTTNHPDQSLVDSLSFFPVGQIGKGEYGSIFYGQLGFFKQPGKRIPVAMKRLNSRKGYEIVKSNWSTEMQGFFIDSDMLEIVVMTMMQQFGRWEEDPYIITPWWLWTTCNEVTPNTGRVTFMEYVDHLRFETLKQWMEKNPSVSAREIIYARLNAYYEHMAYDTPIHLIMHDNHTSNIMVERTASVFPRTAILVILDQAMSSVSVPEQDLDVLPSLDIVINRYRRPGDYGLNYITFFSPVYELAGMLPAGAMAATRSFVTNPSATRSFVSSPSAPL